MARCAARATGAWYDTRGAVAAHTCAEHREVAGELLRARMPARRRLDRWLPAGIRWTLPRTESGRVLERNPALARVRAGRRPPVGVWGVAG